MCQPKTKKCCGITFGIIITLIGIGALIIGFIIVDQVDKLINNGVEDGLKVDYNNYDEEDKRDFIQTNKNFKFYAFNITNLPAALSGTEKLNLQQVGPFNYKEYDYKFNITLENTPDGPIISFNWWWHHNPVTPEDAKFQTEPVLTLNPAYIATIYGIRSINAAFSPVEVDAFKVFAPSVMGLLAQNYLNETGELLSLLRPAMLPFYLGAALANVFGGNTVNWITEWSNGTATMPAVFTGFQIGNIAFADGVKLLNSSSTQSLTNSEGIFAWIKALGGNATLAAALQATYTPTVFLQVAQYIGRITAPSEAGYRAVALGAFSATPPYNTYVGESINGASSWRSVGLVQYATGNVTKALLGVSTAVSDADPSLGYYGPELANYGINLTPAEADTFLTSISNQTLYTSFLGSGACVLPVIPFPAPFTALEPYKAATCNYVLHKMPGFAGLNYAVSRNGGLFTRRPPYDLAFGYPSDRLDPILSLVGQNFPGFFNTHKSQEDGYRRIPGPYKIFTGKDDVQKANMYYAWRNITEFATLSDMFRSSECAFFPPADGCKVWKSKEVIKGLSQNSFFGPFQEKEIRPKIQIFSSDLLRAVNFTYVDDVNVKGVKTRRYEIAEEALKNATGNPANEKYYMTIDSIANLKTGALNTPFHLSRPHFAGCPADVLNRVTGLETPTVAEMREKYWTELYVEPLTGATFKGTKKLQLSMGLERGVYDPNNRYRKLWDIPATLNYTIVPMIWADEYNEINDSDASDFSKLIYDSRDLADTLEIVGYVVGAVLILLGLIMTIYFVRYDASQQSGATELTSTKNIYA